MNENKLWEKFCEKGRVADYLEYKNCVNAVISPNAENKTELKPIDENNGTGSCHKGTEYR